MVAASLHIIRESCVVGENNAFGNALGSSLASGSLSGGNSNSAGGHGAYSGGGGGGGSGSYSASYGADEESSVTLSGSEQAGIINQQDARAMHLPGASRFLFQPEQEDSGIVRMGDTGPVNDTIDPGIPTVTITGHRMSFFEKIDSYFDDAADIFKDTFSTPDYSQKTDYQMAQYPFSNFAANTERVNRAAAQGQLTYTMGGVLTDVTRLGIKGGLAMAALPYAAGAARLMGARPGYALLGGALLTDAGYQGISNLDGSQQGWSPLQSSLSVGLPMVAMGAKPALTWLVSGLENGVNVGGFKILDPNAARMYAVPEGSGGSVPVGGRGMLESVADIPSTGARFGNALSNDYRATFFGAYPDLQGQVIVHHAVEQQVLTRYPGVVTEAEIHSLENLRGIPKELNSDLHLSQIRREWNQFYRQNPNPTQDQLLQKATEIDRKLGSQFNPQAGQ